MPADERNGKLKKKNRRKNGTLIKKFLKTVYFMAKQKWPGKITLKS